jgi:hypothetical protein
MPYHVFLLHFYNNTDDIIMTMIIQWSRVSMKFQSNISETFSVSIIRVDDNKNICIKYYNLSLPFRNLSVFCTLEARNWAVFSVYNPVERILNSKTNRCCKVLRSIEVSRLCYSSGGVTELSLSVSLSVWMSWPVVGISDPIKRNLIDRSLLYY